MLIRDVEGSQEIQKDCACTISFIRTGLRRWRYDLSINYQGFGIAQFNLATPGGNTPAMRPLTVYVLTPYLKTKPT